MHATVSRLLAFAILSAPALAWAGPREEALKCHDEGLAAVKKQDTARAIPHFTKALRLDPNNADVYDSRGQAYLTLHDPDSAIADFATEIRLKPKQARGYRNRGTAHLSKHDLDRMTRFFTKYGGITVLLGRLLPVVRTFIAFPAGIARMPQLRFHIYTFMGSWPWCFALAYAGMKLGERWHTDPRFEQAFHRFHLAVEIALVAAIVWFVWSHLKRGREVESA